MILEKIRIGSLKDYKLHSIYMKGAELNGHKVKHEYKVLGWQILLMKFQQTFPQTVEKTDLKKLTYKEINNQYVKLEKLGLDKYLIEHLPQLIKRKKHRRYTKTLGKSYLKALF